MPPKTDYWKDAIQTYNTIDSTIMTLASVRDDKQRTEEAKEKLQDLIYSLSEIRDIYFQIASEDFDIEFGDADIFRTNIKSASEQIANLLNSQSLIANNKALAEHLQEIQKILNNPEGPISQTQRGLDIFDGVQHDFDAGRLKEYGNGQDLQDAYFGKAPSAIDLIMMDPVKTDPQKVLQTLIWGAEQEFMSDIVNDNPNHVKQNFYREQIDRIFDQFDQDSTLPFDTLVEYASLFEGAKNDLTHRVYNLYYQAKENSPKEEDPDTYACKIMSESDEFLALKGLESKLNQVEIATRFGKIRKKFDVQILTNPLYRNSTKREEFKFGQDIRLDKLDGFYKEHGYKPETDYFQSPKDIEKLTDKLNKSGFDKEPDTKFAEAYKDLMSDKEKASDSFKAMRSTMSQFIAVQNADLSDEKSRFEYESKLTAAGKAALEYYNSHNRYHITENGDKRLDISKRIVNKLKQLQSSLTEYKKSQPVSGYEVKMAFKQQLEYLDAKKISEKQFKKNVQALAKPLLAANLELKPDEIKGVNTKYLAEAFENLDMEDFRSLANDETDIKEFDKISVLYGYISKNDVTSDRYKENEKTREAEALQKYRNSLKPEEKEAEKQPGGLCM